MRLLPALLLLWPPWSAAAQPRPTVTAEATLAWHRTPHSPSGGSTNEAKVIRPVVMARWAFVGGVAARGTLNLEGLTMQAGELLPGGWGEGFVDRRHPHTYLHELILEARRSLGCEGAVACEAGAFLGKGFVPFGSADPMTRGFIAYPVNHHLAQVLERAVLGGQLRVGPGTAEFALFNGDEPERPGQWPRIGGRFGDSWALRIGLRPARGFDAQASLATVTSPEHRPGAGATQHKRHLTAGFHDASTPVRALVEWAETSELGRLFVFSTTLAEVEYRLGRLAVRYRYENTDRPEEERLSPYRSARPHLENSILGVTRWQTHTAGATYRLLSTRGLAAELIAEGSAATVTRRGAGIFDPGTTYGSNRITMGTVALRLAWGHAPHLMGAYGLAADRAAHH